MDAEFPEAALKAVRAVRPRGVALTDDHARQLIAAALPHLTQPDGLDGEYWTLRFDQIDRLLGRLLDTRADAAHQSGVVDAGREAWEKRITQGGTEIPVEDVRVDAAYVRGVAAGRAETLIPRELLHAQVGPSDYEVWRDAWNLAVGNSQREASPNVLRENAEWFHDRLKAGPPAPSDPDCPHCGADSSMDHDDDCPNAPTDDEYCPACGEDEEDCPNCGTDDDEHEEDCPRRES